MTTLAFGLASEAQANVVKIKVQNFNYMSKALKSVKFESKFDLAIKDVKVNLRSSLEHIREKIFKTFHEILCSRIFPCLIML